MRSDIDIPSFSQAVGPANVMPRESLTVDFFQLFVDNRMLGNILRETNRYACQLLQARNKDVRSWKEVSLEELKAFLGLLIAMSIHRLPSLRDYWSSDWVLGVPEFAKVMPRNRFLEIWNNLHLCDNSKMPQSGEPNFDKLFKVREFLNDLNTNFRINYNPHREQAVDEAMIKYQGRTSLKKYMPMKPIKRGIKMWCRADSTNGYLCEFDIYTGKSHKECNKAWVTQSSPSFVNMFKATGTQFSVTIFLPRTGLLRNCISTKYSVVGLCDQAEKSSLHASMTKQRSKE